MPKLRVTLDRDDFERLVNGQKVVTEDGKIEIILADVGRVNLFHDLDRAMRCQQRDRCSRCDLPPDELRGAYNVGGMKLCHRCATPDEKRYSDIAR